ncbi:hypothetical protein BS50DRAFT_535534 [Corynespora cassiicola Philippines]|uniref:N-acetyltransferase domain-containing protein n=1 Tax=Corynespora cassiicola Philippines TaxID=1448308 RepID=A0A2T2N553_CORCC|nr:hypothetical protein BS50DRAFT_535534 [Corynespora cassiicola Philippines]
MKYNEHEAIQTPRILLVPYSPHHVPTYHTWMQDPALREATASEPLSLPEEYAMQESWRLDSNKLTFIVCTAPSPPLAEGATVTPGEQDAAQNMIGDVNLFLYPDEDELDQEGGEPYGYQSLAAELEIMIAREDMQGKGLGREILLAFVWYVLKWHNPISREYHRVNGNGFKESYINYFRVRIGHKNERSVRLFESLGFEKQLDEPNYFGEFELRSRARLDDFERKIESTPVKLSYGS